MGGGGERTGGQERGREGRREDGRAGEITRFSEKEGHKILFYGHHHDEAVMTLVGFITLNTPSESKSPAPTPALLTLAR